METTDKLKEESSISEEEKVSNMNSDESSQTENDVDETGKENQEVTSNPTIEEQLEAKQKELNESQDRYLRLVAEFDNYRKRVLREKTELILNGGERVITNLLPVMDDFERVEQNMANTDDLGSLKEGVNLVIEKFRNTLEREGLKKIDAAGENFNVDYHEAVAMVPGQPEELKGQVIDCIQTGYKLNDKVIRHAKVAVAE